MPQASNLLKNTCQWPLTGTIVRNELNPASFAFIENQTTIAAAPEQNSVEPPVARLTGS